jgi:hypothetical protein
MSGRDAIKWWFTIVFLIAIPAWVHTLLKGSFVVNPDRDGWTFWVGPISTTIPYVFLALLFLSHCFDLKSKSRRSAYCGAVMAWVGMMAFTVFLTFQAPGPSRGAFIGLAMGVTDVCYVPFLVVPYIVGTIVGRIWTKRKDKGLSGH